MSSNVLMDIDSYVYNVTCFLFLLIITLAVFSIFTLYEKMEVKNQSTQEAINQEQLQEEDFIVTDTNNIFKITVIDRERKRVTLEDASGFSPFIVSEKRCLVIARKIIKFEDDIYDKINQAFQKGDKFSKKL